MRKLFAMLLCSMLFVGIQPINSFAETKVSSYLQELDWYNFGIRCYINDVRSDYLNNDVYIQLRAITESVGLDMNYNDDNYSISIKC